MPHVLHTIWVDKHEPTNPDTLWIKPTKKGAYAVYVYGVKGWTMITAEFKGTIGELIVSQLPEATPESNGVMSAEDKAKLDSLGIYYGTTEYWNSQVNFAPPEGSIIIYTDYETTLIDGVSKTLPGIKIGGGNAFVQDLAFVNGGLREDLTSHINDHIVHIAAEDRSRWDNKLNIDDDMEVVEEALIFTRK